MIVGHFEQNYEDSCVPACMCMIQLWRGQAPTEDEFHLGANLDGHNFDLVLRELPRTRELPPMAPGDEDEIRLALVQGQRVIASVLGPPYVQWQRENYPRVTSKHGHLCAPGTWGGPLHAILLIAWRADAYELYDPWFPADQQPFKMSDLVFAKCFAGLAVVALP